MPANHPDAYWQGVSQIIEGESMKARAYVTHAQSLGIAREAIVRRILINETPTRYEVKTGLIRNPHGQASDSSRQCDLLVYDPAFDPPLYRVDDFVVVPNSVARFVVEVKSILDNGAFTEVLQVHDSLIQFQVPCFAFGFDGVAFNTFVTYIRDAVRANRLQLPPERLDLNWPKCVAVHSKNYVAVLPVLRPANSTNVYICLIDYRKANQDAPIGSGQATASFLQFYYALLNNKSLPQDMVKSWFNALPIQNEGKVWITTEGVVNNGTIP